MNETTRLPAGDKNRISYLKKRLIELNALENYPMTDMGAAQLFSDVFRDECRFNSTAGEWFHYDGKVWNIDRGGLFARSAAKDLSRSLAIYAPDAAHTDIDFQSYISYAKKWSGARFRNIVIQDSRDVFFFNNEQLDCNDYVLNVQNGILVLGKDKVEFAPHNADQLLSKICNASYDPNAKCERWGKFLFEIMEGDEAKIRYLQKLFGVCLTGDVRLEKMWFLFGASTRNGKSTLIESISHVLGTYAETIRPETLAIKNNPDSRTASPDVAKLAGTRLVVCSEPPKRMALDTGLIKNLTGRDTITARFLHQCEFSFIPKFKLVCNTNYLPVVSDTTVFTSGRVQVVNFGKHFSEDEQDKTLKSKLHSDEALSAILNWCIEGWLLFCKEGLEAPEAVQNSTMEYAGNSDKIQNFIDDCLEKSNSNVSIKDTYERYGKWCGENGFFVENKRNFIDEIRNKGIFSERGMVSGKQVRNIIKGYNFAFVDADESTPFD